MTGLDATGRITPEGIEDLRSRVGSYYRPRRRNTVASYDNVRIFCRAIGDTNPLYLDRQYGASSFYGSSVVPPTFLYSVIHPTGMRVGGMPGVHAFHSGNEWEWFRPIYAGEQITGTYRPVDVVVKSSEMGGTSVIVYAEVDYFSELGPIARALGWTIRIERRSSQDRGKNQSVSRHVWTSDEVDQILDAYEEEINVRTGSRDLYWDDVNAGDLLPRIVRGPLTLSDLNAWHCVGAGQLLAHEARLADLKRHPAFGYRDPATGSLETIGRVHEQGGVAHGAGVPAPYDVGAQRNAWLGTVLTNWMGDRGELIRLEAEYRRFNLFGDVQWGCARVKDKSVRDGRHLVDLEVWFENQDGKITTPGSATIALPFKTPRPSP